MWVEKTRSSDGRRVAVWHGAEAPPEWDAATWWNEKRCSVCGAQTFKVYHGDVWLPDMIHRREAHRSRPQEPVAKRALPPTRKAFGYDND